MRPGKSRVIEASEAHVHISRLRAAGLGLLAGVMNGLIALGGGVLITPLLVVAGVRPQIAVGTSLAAVTMLSCIGLTAHLLLGGISLGLVPIVGAVIGGAAGIVLGSRVPLMLTSRADPPVARVAAAALAAIFSSADKSRTKTQSSNN